MIRVRASFLGAALASALLAACSNDPNPPPLEETRADGTPWIVQYGALPDDPRSLDPQVSYDTVGNAVIAQIYESLLQYDPFKTDPYELVPCLADGMPERTIHPDKTESYLFKIKPGTVFQDDPCFVATGGRGREVVASDFAYTFKRIADPKVECPVLSTLQVYVAGLKAAYTSAQESGTFDYDAPLEAIEIIDDHTFRLNLRVAYPQILYWMAMPFTAPVPREAVEYYDGKEREQFRFHPVGAGPFRLAEWKRGRLIRLARHPGYSATVFPSTVPPDAARLAPLAGAPLPLIDEVQMSIMRETIPRWLLFRQGYLDGTGVNKDVFSSVLNVSQDLTPHYRERGITLHKAADPSTFYLLLNMADPVLGHNKKLRQAISSAYNQDLANAIFRNGIDINSQQLLPPGLFGYQPNFKHPYKQHNLELARRLMAEAGFPGGRDAKTGKQLVLTLDVTADDAESRQLAEFHKNQIQQLGIRVQVIENLWARQQEKVDQGNFQIVAYGWSADYPDPENFFFLFYGPSIPPQGSNHSRFNHEEFNRLFERMSTMDNTPLRLQMIHRLNEIFTDEVPAVLLSHPTAFSLRPPWAPKITDNPLLNGGAKYAVIDPVLRLAKQREWNHFALWPIWAFAGLAAVGAAFAVRVARRRDV